MARPPLEVREEHVICSPWWYGAAVREAAIESLALIPDQRGAGPGGDRPLSARASMTRASTLFLTMPISWRGILAQYTGQLHGLAMPANAGRHLRLCRWERTDAGEMAVKREAGYRSLGYALYRPISHCKVSRRAGFNCGSQGLRLVSVSPEDDTRLRSHGGGLDPGSPSWDLEAPPPRVQAD
jgi:hypothetical protein